MFKKYSDNEILEGIRRQDEKILTYLYSNFFSTVRSHVLKNSGTSEDASDVFQETIIILFNQVSSNSVDLTSELKGYFFGIARNIWSSQLRQKSRSTELNSDIADDGDSEMQEKEIMSRIVQRSFIKLKEDCQQSLSLYLEGKSYEEVADAMGLKSESYARRKKYLCKEALMEIIKTDPEYQDFDL